MKVLLQGRSAASLQSTPGGDQVQLEHTADLLRSRYAINAAVSALLEPDLTDVDIVHLFGIVRPQEVWVQARHAHAHRKPIVLSTVYCDMTSADTMARTGWTAALARHTSPDLFEAIKALGRGVLNRETGPGLAAMWTRGYTRMQHDIVNMTAMFLPNSHSEWRRLATDLRLSIPRERVLVVPNGVADAYVTQDAPEEELRRVAHFAGAVLCIGRVEARKNQLRLIEALDGTGLTLVLAGHAGTNQRRYVAQVESAVRASPTAHYLGAIPEATKRALYAVGRAHALPSWMETTGLSSLEAAAFGCAVIVSPLGDTQDYFGSDAEYCDPGSVASIRAAVLRAVERGASDALADRIRHQFTWDRAAHATAEAYRRVLA